MFKNVNTKFEYNIDNDLLSKQVKIKTWCIA